MAGLLDSSTAGVSDHLADRLADPPTAPNCRYQNEPCALWRRRHPPSRLGTKRPLGLIPTGPLAGRQKPSNASRSRALDLEQVRLLVNAHMFASSAEIACPLNALLTLVWRRSKHWCGVESWPQLQVRLLDQVTRWLRRHDIATAYLWTRETKQGSGPHTHILLHLGCRPTLVRTSFTRWLETAFDFDSFGVKLTMGRFGALTSKSRAGLLRYLLKGFDQEHFQYWFGEALNTAAELGIENRGPQGTISVKRAGTSQNIALSARRRTAWLERRSIAELRRYLRSEAPPSPLAPPQALPAALPSNACISATASARSLDSAPGSRSDSTRDTTP